MMQVSARLEWTREPAAPGFWGRIAETWRARALILFFARLTLYKTIRRTVLGWLWLPLRGLVPTLVGSLVLGGFLGVKGEGAPYPLFLLSGLIPWVTFASTAIWTVRCLELTRRYTRVAAFPRLVMPLGFSAPAFIDVAMFMATYLCVSLWYGLYEGVSVAMPGPQTVFYLLLAWLAGLGVGLLLCIPGAKVRDIRFSLNYVLSFALALTPVTYPASMIPEKWAFLTTMNPLSAIVEGFRTAALGQPTPSFNNGMVAAVVTLSFFGVGLFVFDRFEKYLTEKV